MRSSKVMTVFSRSRYCRENSGQSDHRHPLRNRAAIDVAVRAAQLVADVFLGIFGRVIKNCMPSRMLSPSGPSGIVEGSGATQAFAESADCGVRGAPKLTELAENRRRCGQRPARQASRSGWRTIESWTSSQGRAKFRSRAAYSTAFAFPVCSAIRGIFRRSVSKLQGKAGPGVAKGIALRRAGGHGKRACSGNNGAFLRNCDMVWPTNGGRE